MSTDYNIILLMIIAGLNAYTAWQSRRTEKNTNSMKDALVAATAKASHAEGKAEGKAEDAATAAAARK